MASNGDKKADYELKVILNMGSDKLKFSGAPLRYLNDSPSSEKILAKPILDHICHKGKNLNRMEIEFFSAEDNMNELLGIYGQSIDNTTTINLDDLNISGNKISLILTANVTEATGQDGKTKVKAENNRNSDKDGYDDEYSNE
jgi:hypothetical protein